MLRSQDWRDEVTTNGLRAGKAAMKAGFFYDDWRGNGVHVSGQRWTVALRLRWWFAFVRPPAKPGYSRLYFGPLEIECRTQTGARSATPVRRV